MPNRDDLLSQITDPVTPSQGDAAAIAREAVRLMVERFAMPAAVPELKPKSKARSVSGRTMLWGRIGTVFADSPRTSAEALKEAGLDWTVEMRDAGFIKSDGTLVKVPGQRFTVRSDNEAPLGLVKSRYKVLNNVDAFAFCDNLVDESGAHFESAFSQNDGRIVGLTMKLPEGLLIDGADPVNQYLMFRTTHDGTGAIQVAVQMVQMNCLNQFNLTLRKAKNRTKIVHSSSTAGKLANVREALKMTFAYDKEFEEECQRLIATPVNDRQAEAILTTCFLNAKHAPDPTKRDVQLIIGNRHTSETIRDEVRSTAYGLMSSFTEHMQHLRKYQSDNAAFELNTRGLGARVQNDLSLELAALHN